MNVCEEFCLSSFVVSSFVVVLFVVVCLVVVCRRAFGLWLGAPEKIAKLFSLFVS